MKFFIFAVILFSICFSYGEENVYSISMLGQEIGTSSEKWSVIQHKDGRCFIKLETNSEMKIMRGPSSMEVSSKSSVFVECNTFKPVSIQTESREPGSSTEGKAVVKENVFSGEIIRGNNRENVSYKMGEGLTFFSMILRKYSPEQLAKGFSKTVISEESLNKVNVTVSGKKLEDHYLINVNYSGIPIDFKIKNGTVVRSDLQNGLISYRLVKSSNLKGEPDVPDRKNKPEIKTDILELASKRNRGINIKDPRRAKTATFSFKGENIPDILSNCYQKVRDIPGGRLVEVDLGKVPCGKGTVEDVHLLPNIFEDSNSPEIIKVAQRIMKKGKNRDDLIERTVSFVFRHIKDKNYNHGNLSASETLKKRAGDCTEHSTLLSALLKAMKIPVKMVYGVVLDPEGRFFFHNWNEVYTDKGWIVVDSTFGMKKSDSARIALVYGGGDSANREEVALTVIRFLANNIEISVEGFSYE